MRLPVDALFARLATALILAAGLGVWGTVAAARPAPPPPPANGPQADYPVVVGASYTVEGTEYVPQDVINYDQVGFIAADEAGGAGITGAHHTLPLPSYVEVTSLETGRTALVRIERRGPMTGTQLIALSPGALAQIEMVPGTPVRVRRVNPPEEQRALLRAGQAAPLRMDTPMPLVEVLRRKLPTAGAPTAQLAVAAAEPQPTQVAEAPALPLLDSSAPAVAEPARPAIARHIAIGQGFVVQAAAFSSADRAARVANALGGDVSRFGPYYRVRTGPFATRGEAEASLAKVRAAGYSDARIFTSG